MAACVLQRLTSVAIKGAVVAVRGFRPVQNHVRSLTVSARLLADRLYTEKHEWVTVDNNIGTVGISQHAQEELGEIVFVQLPDIGTSAGKDEEIASVESVKAASDIFSPVSGKVTSVNHLLEESPKFINESPYEKGWIYKLELSNPDELKELMSEEGYQKMLDSN